MAARDRLCMGLGLALALLSLGGAPGARAAEYRILHQFCADGQTCRDGFNPSAPLARDAQGNLYGTANGGGAHGLGTVFELSPTNNEHWKFEVIHDFCETSGCMDGMAPTAAVIVDQQGNLYGVAAANSNSEEGDGVIYRMHKRGKHWDYEVLYEFCPGDGCDGFGAQTGLAYVGQSTGALYDALTPLYGTASGGGAFGRGLAYALTPHNGTWKHSDIHSFCALADCADGGNPNQPVIVQDAKRLVGVTANGGKGGSGVAFRLTSSDGTSWREDVLHSFCSSKHCSDGGGAPSELATDSVGNLYGTTPTGGACVQDFACGTIFKIAPDGSETVLFKFCKQVGGCKVGSDPETGVTVGADGTLYGTTVAGGDVGSGAIYAFNGKMTLLHSFCDSGCEFGGNPRSPMIIDPQGHLFGVTPQGDVSGGGVVYEVIP